MRMTKKRKRKSTKKRKKKTRKQNKMTNKLSYLIKTVKTFYIIQANHVKKKSLISQISLI